MNLKKRIIYSNVAIVVIPILITIAVTFVYILIFNAKESFESIKKVSQINYEFIKITEVQLNQIKDTLSEKDIGKYYNQLLSDFNVNVVVRKDDDIIYSAKPINKIDIEKCIGFTREKQVTNLIFIDNLKNIVKVIDIEYKDGKKGNIILLAPVAVQDLNNVILIIVILLTYVFSIIVGNWIILYILKKSVTEPIDRLSEALGEISQGNLDVGVCEFGDNEIKELAKSFELMRIKLKESISIQIKYDDNRKMLISSISHDLKTPITSIRGYIEGIIDGVANTPDKVEKYLKTVYSKANEVDYMIDQLLLYSKLDLHQIPFDFEDVDFVRYLEDAVIENEIELEKKNIKLSFRNELKENVMIKIDRDRFKRVVINIINNALKYMGKENGEVVVILRETSNNVIVEIKDNGLGIGREDLPFIFDKFYRCDVTKNRDGSGLGLAISKQIVEGHNGKIWAKSEINLGTSIIISLNK